MAQVGGQSTQLLGEVNWVPWLVIAPIRRSRLEEKIDVVTTGPTNRAMGEVIRCQSTTAWDTKPLKRDPKPICCRDPETEIFECFPADLFARPDGLPLPRLHNCHLASRMRDAPGTARAMHTFERGQALSCADS